jgi:hypothetical protein
MDEIQVRASATGAGALFRKLFKKDLARKSGDT